jgi:hypothetical protein
MERTLSRNDQSRCGECYRRHLQPDVPSLPIDPHAETPPKFRVVVPEEWPPEPI